MDLRFLGTGSAYNPALKSTSAYLPVGNTLLLFDCGETTFSVLHKTGLLNRFHSFIIVITHFHSDHIGSLGSFISFCYCRLHKKVSICYPRPEIRQYLKLTGVPDFMYEHLNSTVSLLNGKLKITPTDVRHDPTIPCFGYLVSCDDFSFFYGGDSVCVPAEIVSLLIDGSVDRIYQDVTYEHDYESSCHGSLERLCRDIPESFRSKVTCMHYDHDFTKQIESCGFHTAVPVKENAYDV